jgi:hypothetical protein
MKELTSESELIPVTQDVIENFCKENSYNLPEDYKQFLLKYNGGTFEECLFPTLDLIYGESYAIANFFYGFLANMPDPYDMYDLHKERRAFDGRVPKEFMPIACDPGGNQICLCIDGDNYGKVYYSISTFQQ